MTEVSPQSDMEVLDASVPVSKEVALASIRRTALSELSSVELGIVRLKELHGATDYDITTSEGYKAATKHRFAIREVRYQVPHVVKARKAELKAVTDELSAVADRITESLRAIEAPHDQRIAGEDARRAEEAARLAEIERIRVQGYQNRLNAIRDCAIRAKDLPSLRIAVGVATVEAIVIEAAAWEEFAQDAIKAKEETLAAMRAMLDEAKAREEAAAARAENVRELARVAEEQRQEGERLARVREEIEQLLKLQRAAREGGTVAAPPTASAPHSQAIEEPAHQPEPPVHVAASTSTDASSTVTATAATIKLGAICDRLGFTLTRAFIESTLGIPAHATDKTAVLWLESDFKPICATLILRVQKVSQ